MNNTTYIRETFDEAYLHVLRNILMFGDAVANTRELRNISISFPNNSGASGILTNGVRDISIEYLQGELYWYLSGSNKLADIVPHSKFWGNISDDGKTANSAYGYILLHKFGFDQIEYVIETLKNDINSRQAVMHIKVPTSQPTKDLNCTFALQFMIRDNKLECYTYMRSTDMWLGIVYDVPYFCILQQMIAKELGIEAGMYTHTMSSCHIYNKNITPEIERCLVNELYKGLANNAAFLKQPIPKYSELKNSELMKSLTEYHKEVIELARNK